MKNLDRTSWIGVIICLALLFAWGWWSAKDTAKRMEAERIAAEEQAAKELAKPTPAESDVQKPENGVAEASATSTVEKKTATLENEFVAFRLTNVGAGIQVAELKKETVTLDGDAPIQVNRTAGNPVGALSTGPDEFDAAAWEVESATDESVVFRTTTAEGFGLTKTYRLPGADSDPYLIDLELTVKNDAATPLAFEGKYLYTGSASPLHLNEWSMQIGMFWYQQDGDFEYETVDHYGGRKVLGIFGKSEIPSDTFTAPGLRWAGVNDQFFATIVEAEESYDTKIWGSRFPIVVEDDEEASRKKRMFSSEAGIGLPEKTLNPGDQQTFRYSIYIGPKEYSRLKALGDDRQRVMHYDEIPIFGWLFGWAIKPIAAALIMGLVFLKGIVGNYGIAIILITIAIRLLIWPVYAKSARSMKRMSKLTPMMQELREKHKDDPQKLNEETMKLYQTYNINPLGGCLPMFIQLPVFLSFYRMLWSAVELRHESFLWVDDLSMPDTLFIIPGLDIPFNLLPILMGLTSLGQIAITPKTGDKTQQTIFMLMPIVFLVICYNFAAALSLYWTTSNAFSILQTWLMNKLPEPELKKRNASGKKTFMQRMQDQAEAAQKAKAGGGAATGRDRTRIAGEKGERHTKSRKKRR